MAKAKVTLFKSSGKYYTDEEWEIPTEETYEPREEETESPLRGDFVGPYCMRWSPDFHRIGQGKVLVHTQEPWGFPHLI